MQFQLQFQFYSKHPSYPPFLPVYVCFSEVFVPRQLYFPTLEPSASVVEHKIL